MPKTGNELGTKSPFRLRVGIDFQTFRGVNKEGDPGSIADAELQEAINGRILPSGAIVSRGGQEKLNTDPLDSCVYGIIDDEVKAAGPGWWFGTGGTVGGSAFNGLNKVDTANGTLDYATDHAYQFGGYWYCAALYGEELLFISGDVFQLRRWNPEDETSTLLHDFGPLAPGDCRGMAVADGILYIPIRDSLSSGVVMYAWDGAAMVVDHDFGPNVGGSGGLAMSFEDEAYFAYFDNDGPNEVWRRLAGVWTSLAMPAVARFSCADWTIYDGKLWMSGANYDAGGRSGVILSYDGATLVLERQIGDPTADGYAITALATDEETLFFAHNGTIAPDTFGRIGTYDGSTWTNNVKDLIDQFGQNASDNAVTAMFVQDGRVYVAAGSYLIKGSGTAVFILRSPVNTIEGNWTVVGRIFAFSTNQQKAYL